MRDSFKFAGLLVAVALLAVVIACLQEGPTPRPPRQVETSDERASSVARLDPKTEIAVTKTQSPTSVASVGAEKTPAEPSANSSQLRLVRKPEAAPAWAVRFGSEFWRSASSAAPASVPSSGGDLPVSPVRVGEALDRVTHAFTLDAVGVTARVKGDAYRASLDAAGLAFVPVVFGAEDSRSESTAHLRTRSAHRGTRSLLAADSPSRDWLVTGNTAQALLDSASGLVEHYEARCGGVEVTWIAPRLPAGEGDLVIEAELTGVQLNCQTASGLHYAGANGVTRVKVGSVLAVDTRGRSWPLSFQAVGELLRVVVPGELLALATFPLAMDPIISPEFGVDQPASGPSPCTRAVPSVAAHDSGYLVVWTHGKGDATTPGLYAARLDPAGNLLDPYDLLLSGTVGEQTACAVAANADVCLAVWTAPHGTSTTDWDILGARIRSDGTLLSTTPFAICNSAGAVRATPAVAANGTNFLAVWRDGRNTGIYRAVVTTNGSVSPLNGASVSSAANDQFTPAVASLGGNYLVVWQDYRQASLASYYSDIYGARVAGDGTLVDTAGIGICTRTHSQYHPAVAANGTNYLVVWEDYDLGGNDICGARVSADGAVLDAGAFVIAHATNNQARPALAANGEDSLVVWQDYRNSPTNNFEARIHGARVHGDGTVAEPDGVALCTGSGGQWSPALARHGNDFFVAWQDFRDNPGTVLAGIRGARVSATTNPVRPLDSPPGRFGDERTVVPFPPDAARPRSTRSRGSIHRADGWLAKENPRRRRASAVGQAATTRLGKRRRAGWCPANSHRLGCARRLRRSSRVHPERGRPNRAEAPLSGRGLRPTRTQPPKDGKDRSASGDGVWGLSGSARSVLSIRC